MLVIGVDPGLNGAVALADAKEVHTVELLKDINLYEWLLQVTTGNKCHVYLETPTPRPGQAVKAVFSSGRGFGKIETLLEDVLKLPHTQVAPSAWTKEMHKGCSGETAKEKSLQAAKRLFPHMKLVATEKSKKPHDGIVDALLICEYGRRQQFRS